MSIEKIRVDKWLWAVRIFKSRGLSSDACKSGKVKIHEKSIKASHLVKLGDTLTVRKEGFDLVLKVTKLITKRVSATLAEECLVNLTSDEEMNKYKDWYIGKAKAERRDKGAGRPTKKERRELEDYKEQAFLFEDWID